MSLPSSYLGQLDISEFYLEVGKAGAMQLMAEEMAERYSSAHCSTEMIKTEIQTSMQRSQCWALNQVQLVGRSLPEEDGGERVPSKQVRWVERVPLQVKIAEIYKLIHNSSIEKMAFVCGTPCTGMWRGLSTLCIHVIR